MKDGRLKIRKRESGNRKPDLVEWLFEAEVKVKVEYASDLGVLFFCLALAWTLALVFEVEVKVEAEIMNNVECKMYNALRFCFFS